MNQAFLFNDDLQFNTDQKAWCLTAQLAGQRVIVYFHSKELSQQTQLSECTKFDLEEVAELWLESNEFEGGDIHIQMK